MSKFCRLCIAEALFLKTFSFTLFHFRISRFEPIEIGRKVEKFRRIHRVAWVEMQVVVVLTDVQSLCACVALQVSNADQFDDVYYSLRGTHAHLYVTHF